MSEVSIRQETVDRQTVMIPIHGAVRNLYDLLRRVETQAKEMGITTEFDDYAHYQFVLEDTAIGVILEKPRDEWPGRRLPPIKKDDH